MFTQIFNRRAIIGAVLGTLLATGGCAGSKPDNSKLAEAEQKAAKAADEDGRILCALGGTTAFDRNCTMDRVSGQNGDEIVLSNGSGGFRRLRILPRGGGVAAADGAEPAKQAIVDDGVLEVTIGTDRYRLPAATKPKIANAAQSPLKAAVAKTPVAK